MHKTFCVTEEMVERFVELTGDRSAIHVNEQLARRLRYRTRVVHGMLPFSFLHLLLEEHESAPLDLASVDARFLKPVFAGGELTLALSVAPLPEPDGSFSFEAKWTGAPGGEALIMAKGRLRKSSIPPSSARAATETRSEETFLDSPLTEATHTLADLADRNEAFTFRITPRAALSYRRLVLGAGADGVAPGPNLLATILCSTLVGMRLPGRYATFTGFELSFAEDLVLGRRYQLSGTVRKVFATAEALDIAALISESGRPLAQGRLAVVVNSVPKEPLSCEEIRQRHMDLGLADRVAVVTGSSRGIGAATAKLLALLGAKVVVTYFKGESDGEAVVRDIRASGGQAILVGVDVTDESQVEALFAEAVAAFGGMDVLVNNAVKDTLTRPAMELLWADYLGELEVSLRGVHHCCRVAVPLMKQRGGGKIINLSTLFVDHPPPNQSKYITAKSAVVGYTRALAREVCRDNIQVNILAPNMTETDLLATLPAEIVKRMGRNRPAGRNLQPIEVAQAVAFLASQWSNGIVGEKLVLNLGEPPFV